MRILGKECPEQLSVFKTVRPSHFLSASTFYSFNFLFKKCMAQYGEEAKCSDQKEELNACGSEAFRMVNNSKEYSF
jgi:hypothetical protein